MNESKSIFHNQKSIAVLPFVNMGSDPENEYFSNGVTEEIINALTKIKGLKVIARTSSFAFKNQSVDVRQIGQKLGVTTILEGSIRKASNQVRITAQLINFKHDPFLKPLHGHQRFQGLLQSVFHPRLLPTGKNEGKRSPSKDKEPARVEKEVQRHLGKNFNEYINSYRIKSFKKKALDPANRHLTLLGLAYESGFNSKTVFNSFFKKTEGQTPRQWVKSARTRE